MQELEPIAFGFCGLLPNELWNMTPAELRAIVEAKIQFSPTGILKKRRENFEDQMTPEQIAEKLKTIAGVK